MDTTNTHRVTPWEDLERVGRQWEQQALRSVAVSQMERLVALENQRAVRWCLRDQER